MNFWAASDVERRMFASQADCIVESIAVRHQRGGGEDAVAVRLHNAFVDVGRETEIVRVHYQLFT